MSQNDLVIANQSFPATRADINSALQALGSLNSGSSAPATTYANMLWYDTTNNTLKMRAEANDQWISIGYLDQTADAFRIFDDTQVVNSSGTQTGLIGDQSTSAWQAGTSTTESLVSPAKIKAAANFTAFAEGAAGQPRIIGEAAAAIDEVAVLTVSASDAYSLSLAAPITTGTLSTSSSSFVTAYTIDVLKASGTARFVCQHRGYISGGGYSQMRLLKNGTQIAIWDNTSNVFVTRTVDVSVSPSDQFKWEHRLSAGTGPVTVTGAVTNASNGYAFTSLIIKKSEL
jgi:hypothetical protein